MAPAPAHAARDHRSRAHRPRGRQRRRRSLDLRPGGAELRLLAAVVPAPAHPGPDRQPGDGRASRRRHRRRLRAPDLGALRPRVGLVLGGRHLLPQLLDDQHRVHGRQPRRRLLRAQAGRHRPDRGRAVDRDHRQRQLPPLGAGDVLLPLREPSRSAARRPEPSERGRGAARVCRPGRRGWADIELSVVHRRHRRHHGRAVADVLSAVERDRQAHHAALARL